MKKTILVSSETHLHAVRRSARKLRSCLAMSTLLMTAAALLGPGGGQRCAAQFFPPGPYQQDEVTFSIGVFQIQVDPNFAFLFAPVSPNTVYYPGYSPSSGVLTSPVMYDGSTAIGTSIDMDYDSATFPLTVGDPAGFGAAVNNPANVIGSTGDFIVMPVDFEYPSYAMPNPGPHELFTEIISLDLTCDSSYLSCGTDERVPAPPGTQLTLVSAGPKSKFQIDWSDPLNLNRRSLGMVQQQTDPVPPAAKSFFDINVQVNLPAVALTASVNDFPTCPAPFNAFGWAQLTNDPLSPLVIINPTNVTKLPPDAVYVHGLTETAVPLYFLTNNAPHWNKGDLLGYIMLAGHGVFACTNASSQDTNCCQTVSAQGRVASLLDFTLGPVGNPKPSMPIPWNRSDYLFPNTNTTYNSVVNTVVDKTTGHTNVLDAAVGFTNLSLSVRDLMVGGFPYPIVPPAAGGSQIYTATNVPISFQIVNFGAATPHAGTCSVTMQISNTGLWSLTLTNMSGTPPPVNIYTLRLLALKSLSTSGGPAYLRVLTNNPSVGQHTIRQTAGGYRVSSFFDVWLQLSTDNVNWFSASNSIRILPSVPPAAWPKSISVALRGNQVILNWPGNAVLQSATNVLVGWGDLNSGAAIVGPYTNDISAKQKFFRLRKP
jgi:hypothetical protein